MTALRFQTGGDIRHPRPPFERVIVVVVFVEVTVVVVVMVVIGLLGVHDLKRRRRKKAVKMMLLKYHKAPPIQLRITYLRQIYTWAHT